MHVWNIVSFGRLFYARISCHFKLYIACILMQWYRCCFWWYG